MSNQESAETPTNVALDAALKVAAPDGGAYQLGEHYFRQNMQGGGSLNAALHEAVRYAAWHSDNRASRMREAKRTFWRVRKEQLQIVKKSTKGHRSSERVTRTDATAFFVEHFGPTPEPAH
jgi:hypothetical protein